MGRARCTAFVVAVALSAVVLGGQAAHAGTLGPSIPGPTDTEIIGGTPVPDGQYRFQAALLAQPFGSNDFQRQYCGGSLIGAFYVLTAAHCVDFVGNRPGADLRLSELKVVVGRTVLTSTQGQKRSVSRIVIHPGWNPNTGKDDAAVIQLSAPITGINPIRLATTGTDALERPGRLATVTGWGNTIRQEPGPTAGPTNFPNRLRVAQVPIVADDECQASYQMFGGIHPNTEICAGRTGKDTCQGDSGGPMFVAVTGGFRQIGITSSGAGCGATGFPGIYTQVSSYEVGNFIARATGGVPSP